METTLAPPNLTQSSFPQLPANAFFPDDTNSFTTFEEDDDWARIKGEVGEENVFGRISVLEAGRVADWSGPEGGEDGGGEVRRGSYAHARDWAGPEDEGNPNNWTLRKRLYHTAIPAGFALLCTFASSVYTSGLEQTQVEFNISTEVSLVPYVLYVLGLAFGPVISAPCSEAFGRRIVYLVCVPIFALFTLGVGFSQNIESLCICRFLAGVFGSPALAIGAATMSDIWPPAVRAVPMCFYVSTPFLGPALGPLIGGFVTEKRGWRWTQWVVLFLTVLVYVPAIFIEESYKKKVLQTRARREHIEGPLTPDRTTWQSAQFFLTTTITRPVHMLCTEPVVACFGAYIGFNFALQYSFFTAFPLVFKDIYGFNLGAQGLSFIGLGIGGMVGLVTMILIDRTIYRRKAAKVKGQTGNYTSQAPKLAPEHRLYYAFMGSPCIPFSLFLFGWTARSEVPWLIPIIAEVFFGFGNCLVFQSATMYMMDSYGPLTGASAMGANALMRYGLGTFIPLFSLQLFGFKGKGLGIGGASSLLGGLSCILACIPWVFWYLGPRLRKRSGYVRAK